MSLETFAVDPARYLDSDEAVDGFMEGAFETGDPTFIARAFGAVARARRMTRIARDAGVSRESLYQTLGKAVAPEPATAPRAAKALGLKPGVASGAK